MGFPPLLLPFSDTKNPFDYSRVYTFVPIAADPVAWPIVASPPVAEQASSALVTLPTQYSRWSIPTSPARDLSLGMASPHGSH